MGVVAVVGSANVDTAVLIDRHPRPGETVLGSAIGVGPGGKGLNQAVAAARAGTTTIFVGATGDDAASAMVREALRECGVEHVLAESARPTGTAYVMVSEAGENAIVVTPGANGDAAALGTSVDRGLENLRSSDVVLIQLEIPPAIVARALRCARGAGATSVLNAAPSLALADDVLGLIGILVVNEHECLALAPEYEDLTHAAAALALKVGTVIVTLGAAGCWIVTGDQAVTRAAFPAIAVDTTAAGDTFCGALSAELASGAELVPAVDFAMAAAAITVQRHGAVASIPQRAEVEALLASRTSRGTDGERA